MLAVIMGLMLAFDMGGPVNKVAYAFMLICVAQGFIPWWPLLPWVFVSRRWGWGWRR